jgi:hypothetical protein
MRQIAVPIPPDKSIRIPYQTSNPKKALVKMVKHFSDENSLNMSKF